MLKKRLLGKLGELRIWLVDGSQVRSMAYSGFKYNKEGTKSICPADFIEGGHDLIYPWIPADSIFIDDALPVKDREHVIMHEIYERKLMLKGWPYLKAHKRANQMENAIRRNPDKTIESWNKSWSSDLTESEKGSISRFSNQGYSLINRMLRSGDTKNSRIRNDVSFLDSAISKAKTPKPMIVYRGVNLDSSKLHVGKVITDSGYLSTSLSKKTALRAANGPYDNVLFQISVPLGTNAAYLGKLGLVQSGRTENELLLPRDSSMRIDSIEDVELPHPDDSSIKVHPKLIKMTYLKSVENAIRRNPDRSDAEPILAALRKAGLKPKLVGSVATKGHSDHDIDIAVPVSSEGREEAYSMEDYSDYRKCLAVMRGLGFKQTMSADEDAMDTWLKGNLTVDIWPQVSEYNPGVRRNPEDIDDVLDRILKIRTAMDRNRALRALLFSWNAEGGLCLNSSISRRIKPGKLREATRAIINEVERFGAGTAYAKVNLMKGIREVLHEYITSDEKNPVIVRHPAEERKRRYAELRAAGVPVSHSQGYRDLRPTKYAQIGKQAMQYYSGHDVTLEEPIKYRWWENPTENKSSILPLIGIGFLIAGLIYLNKKAQEPQSITSLPTNPPYRQTTSAPAPSYSEEEE